MSQTDPADAECIHEPAVQYRCFDADPASFRRQAQRNIRGKIRHCRAFQGSMPDNVFFCKFKVVQFQTV